MIAPITALNAQLDAITMINLLNSRKAGIGLDWDNDVISLAAAEPFLWATDPIRACLEASRTMPGDTPLSRANLPVQAAWWYFEEPLCIQTTDKDTPIRAMMLSWMQDPSSRKNIRFFRLAVWNDENVIPRFALAPSQVWGWLEGETLDQMLARVRVDHQLLYGPGGRLKHSLQVGVDIFMSAAERLSRFVLAATAWLDQKVLTDEIASVERHRRKEFERTTKRLPTLRVIHLRRTQRDETRADSHSETRTVEWSHQWTVDGHWRNQPCGPQHADRKLTWIHPFVKGPVDKPFQARVQKVYEVSR